jgi:hypothetical protein
MMDEEKTRKALDNLVRDIAVSTKRSKTLSQLTNKELAEKLISDVWGILKLFGEKSDLLTEVIERLFVLDTPELEQERRWIHEGKTIIVKKGGK